MNSFSDKFENPWYSPFLTAIGYYFAAWFAVHHTIMPSGIAIIWPPNSILLAALLVSSKRYWIRHIIAAAFAEIAADWGSFHFWQILGFATVNILECGTSAFLIQYLLNKRLITSEMGFFTMTCLIAVLLMPGLAAFLGALLYYSGDGLPHYLHLWRVWWFGDAVGLSVFLPLLIVMIYNQRAWRAKVFDFELRRLVIPHMLAALIVWIVFYPFTALYSWHFSPSLFLVFLMWLSARFSLPATLYFSSAISLITIVATKYGYGPFIEQQNELKSVLSTQEFLMTMSLFGLFLSLAFNAVKSANRDLLIEVAKREDIQKKLVSAYEEQEVLNQQLEFRVDARTRELSEINQQLHKKLESLNQEYEKIRSRHDVLVTDLAKSALRKADMTQSHIRLSKEVKRYNDEIKVLREQIDFFVHLINRDAASIE